MRRSALTTFISHSALAVPRVVRNAFAAALLALALVPAAAPAHAVLAETSPPRGASLDVVPEGVTFTFNERVEASFGAVRVYDASGKRVDDGRVTRPGGRAESVAVGLQDEAGDGRYTATYRVVSADSHPVSGGFVFTVGEPGGSSSASVSDLLEGSEAGPVTTTGFGVVRGVGYAALAVAIGALFFLFAVWAPAYATVAGSGPAWLHASDGLLRRLRAILLVATAAGALTSLLALVFQGALAGGTSVWAALDPSVVGEVLDTRFGTASAVRLAAWLVAGAVLVGALSGVGLAPARPLPLPAAVAAGAALAVAALTFGLAGHAGSTSPVWLMMPADVLHILAMGAWIGGLVLLLGAVPAATRALDPADRTRLLAAVVTRFSAIALLAVGTLVATGTVQSIVHLGAVADLWETAFGRAIAVKVALLGGLVWLGYLNQRRFAPQLRVLAGTGAPPGAPGRGLRDAVRAEIALAAAVIGVTAALVSYAPASAQDDVLSRSISLGPARVEVTVEPLRAGPHEIHLYLFDARTGAALDRFDDLEVTAALPEKDLGPIEVDLRKAGPGHFTTSAAPISPGGDWELAFKLRTNRFDIDRATVPLEVRG
jgi:copper transport protein